MLRLRGPVRKSHDPNRYPRTEALLDALRAWCADHHGRQAEVARALGVSPQAVNSWCSHDRFPQSEQTLGLWGFLHAQGALDEPTPAPPRPKRRHRHE